MKPRKPKPDDLETVPGVGPSIAQDLRDLGVTSVAALARRDPERLSRTLNEQTGTLDVKGNFSRTSGTFNANTGTTILSGATTQTVQKQHGISSAVTLAVKTGLTGAGIRGHFAAFLLSVCNRLG